MICPEDFSPVTLEDRDLFASFYRSYPQLHSDNSFANMACWNHYAHYRKAVRGDHLLLSSTVAGETRFRFPIGPYDETLADLANREVDYLVLHAVRINAFRPLLNPQSDVRRLLVNRREHTARLVIEPVVGLGVADVPDRLPDDGFEVPALRIQRLEAGVGVLLGVHALGQDDRILRELELRMESSALRPLNAVRGPRTTKLLEVLRDSGMPVPRREDREAAATEQLDRPIDAGDDPVALRHAEGPTGAEVILHVNDEQGRLARHGRPQVTMRAP